MPTIEALLLLSASAFGAATLLPLQSEALLVAFLLKWPAAADTLLLTATLGNVAGSWVNWGLGRYLLHLRERRWFPVSDEALERAQRHYARFGYWTLLGSWLPVIGDPLTLLAGALREPLWRFLLLVTLAKAGRYLVLAALTLS